MIVRAIRLSPRDNVVVCCCAVEPGERIAIDGHEIVVAERVPLGHKLALVPLAAGQKVLKYGMPIGSMTADAAPGAWVHMHNMKSDYLAAHLRDTVGDPS